MLQPLKEHPELPVETSVKQMEAMPGSYTTGTRVPGLVLNVFLVISSIGESGTEGRRRGDTGEGSV
jgi:hypothetical protein